MKQEWLIPTKILSEANNTEHWSAKYRRKRTVQSLIRIHLADLKIKPPCHVRLIRISPRGLDKEDNLPMAMKSVKDYVADKLIPGLAPGRADGDPRITWSIEQERWQPKQYALKIIIESNDEISTTE